MATNLALDDKLIRETVRLGRHKTKKEAVTAALLRPSCITEELAMVGCGFSRRIEACLLGGIVRK